MTVEMEQVIKRYDQFCLNISLKAVPGQITGLVGPNGAGKSTAFKSILGLTNIDGGSISVFDKPHGSLTPKDKQDISVVLSDSGFSGYLTTNSIVAIMAAMYPDFDKKGFLARCRGFSLPLKKKIKDFSTGMRAKLKLSLALSHPSKLLILDEPTAGLDVIARDELLTLLREYMEEDEARSILISSHISSDLEGLCDDIYFIHDGQIVLHEDTDVLLGSYASLKVDEKQFEKLDKQYIISAVRESFGYLLLTDQKQFYLENYPDIVVQKGSIDDIILLKVKGEPV